MSSSPILWNRFVRLLHWGVSIGVTVNFFNNGVGYKQVHLIAGYSAVSFLALRIVYGVFARAESAEHAKFRNWPFAPKHFIAFIKGEITRQPVDFPGHNPLACWTYVLIWMLIVALTISGYMMDLHDYFGEQWLINLHATFRNALLILVFIHLGALTKDSLQHRRLTWLGMITGRRKTFRQND